MFMKQKAFTLIELLVVVAIIGILAAVGVVAYNGYTGAAKEKTTEANFKNINKSLMFEFMRCEIDSSSLIFDTHSCGNNNPPSTSLIGSYLTNKLRIKNPYNTSSSGISSNPCNLGTVSITTSSKGNYSINYYSSPSKKITTTNIGTTWTPVKVTGYTTYTPVKIGCNTTYTQVKITGKTTYTNINP